MALPGRGRLFSRAGLTDDPRKDCGSFSPLFTGRVTDDIGWLEGPCQGLDPWHDRQDADVTHQIERYPARKTEDQDGQRKHRRDNDERGCEGQIVPGVDVKAY